METTNKLFYSGTKFFTENEEDYRITVRISLDDGCKNNICDWSITADVDWKNKHGKYEDYLGGCCHDEVAKHFPELAKFISLHLCNHYGAPMYPVENGTLRWVDEERQEIDAKGLDCLGYVRELRVDDYLSPTTLEEIAEEIKKKVNRG